MTPTQILDTVEQLMAAARHPDVTRVYRFTGALTGVAVEYGSGAKVFFSLQPERAAVTPAELPEDLGEWKFRANHALKLLLDLLALAQPQGLRWRTVAVAGVHNSPSAIEFGGAGGSVLVRVTSGSPLEHDSDPAEWAGWAIPEGITAE